jgi:hypothetical protein
LRSPTPHRGSRRASKWPMPSLISVHTGIFFRSPKGRATSLNLAPIYRSRRSSGRSRPRFSTRPQRNKAGLTAATPSNNTSTPRLRSTSRARIKTLSRQNSARLDLKTMPTQNPRPNPHENSKLQAPNVAENTHAKSVTQHSTSLTQVPKRVLPIPESRHQHESRKELQLI